MNAFVRQMTEQAESIYRVTNMDRMKSAA